MVPPDWTPRRDTLKFYDYTTAPSPRRVRIFLAEKGLSVPTQQVDLRNREQFAPAFTALNPACTVPVLQLYDGATITDVLSLCRYSEKLHPYRPVMARAPEARPAPASWARRSEWTGVAAATAAFRSR